MNKKKNHANNAGENCRCLLPKFFERVNVEDSANPIETVNNFSPKTEQDAYSSMWFLETNPIFRSISRSNFNFEIHVRNVTPLDYRNFINLNKINSSIKQPFAGFDRRF